MNQGPDESESSCESAKPWNIGCLTPFYFYNQRYRSPERIEALGYCLAVRPDLLEAQTAKFEYVSLELSVSFDCPKGSH
jgi:hypothetical protein